MILDGYQVWGCARSWLVQQYKGGRVVWESKWFWSEEEANRELRKLQS